MIELYESNLLKMTTAKKKAQCVSCFIETKSDVHTQRTTAKKKAQCVSCFIETKSDVHTQRNYRVSMEETHHHVLQFVYGTRNLWRQGQCSMQGGVGDQDHLKKMSSV